MTGSYRTAVVRFIPDNRCPVIIGFPYKSPYKTLPLTPKGGSGLAPAREGERNEFL